MDKPELMSYLERLDEAVQNPATLYIDGSAARILLDEPDRTSLDIDIAAPCSQADEADLRRAAEAAGLPVNPDEEYGGDHIEWVGPLRLCPPARLVTGLITERGICEASEEGTLGLYPEMACEGAR